MHTTIRVCVCTWVCVHIIGISSMLSFSAVIVRNVKGESNRIYLASEITGRRDMAECYV